MEPKKQKKKRRYTLLIVSNSAEGGIRQFKLEQKLATVFAAIILTVAMAGGCYVGYSAVSVNRTLEVNQALNTKIENLTAENEELTVRNTELTENITLLSDTINEKVQQEEENAEKRIPSGFPLAGAAVIQESSEPEPAEDAEAEGAQEAEAEDAAQEDGDGEELEQPEEEKEPIVVFSASTGTSVIVTGSGVVEAVEPDEEYGSRVVVNHGNGYMTVYRNPSPAKVKVGDEITKGTMLIEMTTDEELLGYQIIKDGAYIDPLELMEIYG